MSREYPQMRLRMPPELRDKIEKSSQELGRSMNAEIVHRLERSFDKALAMSPDRLAEIEDQLLSASERDVKAGNYDAVQQELAGAAANASLAESIRSKCDMLLDVVFSDERAAARRERRLDILTREINRVRQYIGNDPSANGIPEQVIFQLEQLLINGQPNLGNLSLTLLAIKNAINERR